MTPEEVQAIQSGVYIDGHWGQYGTARLVTLAVEMGWQPANDAKQGHEKAILKLEEMTYPGKDNELTVDDEELIYWTSEIAEEWLNEHRRPDTLQWQWYEGEFGLWDDEDEDVA